MGALTAQSCPAAPSPGSVAAMGIRISLGIAAVAVSLAVGTAAPAVLAPTYRKLMSGYPRARQARAKRIVVHPALDAATSAMPPRGLSKLASTTFGNRNLRRRRNHGFRHQHGADRVRCQLAFSDFTRFQQAANGIIDSCLACNRCQMQNRQITPRSKFPQRIPQPYECGWYSH